MVRLLGLRVLKPWLVLGVDVPHAQLHRPDVLEALDVPVIHGGLAPPRRSRSAQVSGGSDCRLPGVEGVEHSPDAVP
ncbi:MAG: hypothetical protein DMF78_22795 [Acidobacteria bacterium]|nr:MAG: hypothetical protein DMF78_22795 [Acidobacteriota bacterium]